jgi:PIN domain nuclease of toxin-antitoxin system
MTEPHEGGAVIDASALLCWLFREPGAHLVEPYLAAGASISTVNLAEVTCKLSDRAVPGEDIDRIIDELPVEVRNLDIGTVRQIYRLRAACRPLGLSMGDMACIATGLQAGVRIVTADGVWKKLPRRIASTIVFVR